MSGEAIVLVLFVGLLVAGTVFTVQGIARVWQKWTHKPDNVQPLTSKTTKEEPKKFKKAA